MCYQRHVRISLNNKIGQNAHTAMRVRLVERETECHVLAMRNETTNDTLTFCDRTFQLFRFKIVFK